jgi:hypothetical protein
MARQVWKENRTARDQGQRFALIDMPEAPASEIYREMELRGTIVDGRPSQRSVERWVIKARGTSVPRWDPWHENSSWRGEDIRLTFLVLRQVVRATAGRVRWFSEIEARKIADIQTIVPEMPPLSVWNIARLYLLRERNGEDSQSIDEWLMFSIDSDKTGEEAWMTLYDEVVAKGFMRGLPDGVLDFIKARPDYTRTREKSHG